MQPPEERPLALDAATSESRRGEKLKEKTLQEPGFEPVLPAHHRSHLAVQTHPPTGTGHGGVFSLDDRVSAQDHPAALGQMVLQLAHV
jgi:hypothetical protein